MGALRKQMDDDMVVRGMAERTRETYLSAVAAMAKFYRRSPDEVSEVEVQRYLLHLIQERKLAWSSCNIAVNALKFCYHVTLKHPQAQFEIPSPRQPQKLPQILAREEVARLIESTVNPKHRAMLMTTYGAGLRVSELCHLKVSDIDSPAHDHPGGARQGCEMLYITFLALCVREPYVAAARQKPIGKHVAALRTAT